MGRPESTRQEALVWDMMKSRPKKKLSCQGERVETAERSIEGGRGGATKSIRWPQSTCVARSETKVRVYMMKLKSLRRRTMQGCLDSDHQVNVAPQNIERQPRFQSRHLSDSMRTLPLHGLEVHSGAERAQRRCVTLA